MTLGYSAENAAGEPGINRRSDKRTKKGRQMKGNTPLSWKECFYAALLADRVTVNATTGITPYRFLMGGDAILPIEFEVPTWSTLPWETVESREDLIALRARQILQRDHDIEEAIYRLKRLRDQNKDYVDSKRTLRESPLEKGNIVLLHDTIDETSYTSDKKLRYRWLGPYRIREVKRHGSYALEELDGTPVYQWPRPDGGYDDSVNGNRLKRFWFQRDTGVRAQSFPPHAVTSVHTDIEQEEAEGDSDEEYRE